MVKLTHRVGVKVDEFAREVDRHQLPKTAPVVDVARHDSLGQIGADGHLVAGLHDGLARAERTDFAHRVLEEPAFFVCQAYLAAIGEKAV